MDADFNEQIQIARHDRMRALSSMVGHIDKRICDGFKVIQKGENNTVTIKAGLCAVHIADKLAINLRLAADTDFDTFTTPSGSDRTDYLYLDIYFDEIDSTEDTGLINPARGQESAIDYRLKWSFAKSEGAAPGTPPAGHTYLSIAKIERQDGDATIVTADITNLLPDQHAVIRSDEDGTINGSLTIEDDLTVNTNTDLNGTLDVDGKTIIDDDLDVTLNLDVNGTANIQGDLTVQNDIIMSADKKVDGIDPSKIGYTIWMQDVCVDYSTDNAGQEADEYGDTHPDFYPAFHTTGTAEERKVHFPYRKIANEANLRVSFECWLYRINEGKLIIKAFGLETEYNIINVPDWGFQETSLNIAGTSAGTKTDIEIYLKTTHTSPPTDLYVRRTVIYATFD